MPVMDSSTRTALEIWSAKPRRAVLFDFNGTLSNDEPLLLKLYIELVDEYFSAVLTNEQYYAQLVGRADREIFEDLVAQFGGTPDLVEHLLEERSHRYLKLAAAVSPIEDATVKMLDLLAAHRVPLGIVTGAPVKEVAFVLTHRGLIDRFGAIVTEEDVVHGKPEPEGYLLAAAQMGLDPSQVLAFEDSLPGVAAAKAAGMAVIGVLGSTDPAALGEAADGVVTELTGLLFEDQLS